MDHRKNFGRNQAEQPNVSFFFFFNFFRSSENLKLVGEDDRKIQDGQKTHLWLEKTPETGKFPTKATILDHIGIF